MPWLAYTRLYFFLQPRHLTFDGGWMYIFNKPDPTCGLTRTLPGCGAAISAARLPSIPSGRLYS